MVAATAGGRGFRDGPMIGIGGSLAAPPLPHVDWYGTPHTQALHVVERYRLIDYEAAVGSQFQKDANLPWIRNRIPPTIAILEAETPAPASNCVTDEKNAHMASKIATEPLRQSAMNIQ